MVIRMEETKVLISGYILKVELTGFANVLDRSLKQITMRMHLLKVAPHPNNQ